MKTAADARLQAVLRRDRLVILVALGVVTMLAWVYIVYMAVQMDMGGMDMAGFRMAMTATGMLMMPAFEPWTRAEFAFTVVMWVVMMVGMMTPSAAPVILLYARVGRQAAMEGKPFASALWFAGGYVAAWTLFGIVAAAMQWALDRAALLSARMAAVSVPLGAAVLLGAGLYQWSSLKDRCLSQCQSPLQFILGNGGFRRDAAGSLRLGMRHGFYCVGCCWALMLLLFVGGVMNVLWISGLAILVLAEKAAHRSRLISRITGTVCVFAAVLLLLAR